MTPVSATCVWWRRRAFHIDCMPKHGREATPNQASGFTLFGANSFTPPQSASLRLSPRSPRMRLKPLGYAHQSCHQRPGFIYRFVHLDTALRCTHFPKSFCTAGRSALLNHGCPADLFSRVGIFRHQPTFLIQSHLQSSRDQEIGTKSVAGGLLIGVSEVEVSSYYSGAKDP